MINNEKHFNIYISSYGDMHQAKLFEAFYLIDEYYRVNEKKIQIIDYGCGQGIGSMVFLDILKLSIFNGDKK